MDNTEYGATTSVSAVDICGEKKKEEKREKIEKNKKKPVSYVITDSVVEGELHISSISLKL